MSDTPIYVHCKNLIICYCSSSTVDSVVRHEVVPGQYVVRNAKKPAFSPAIPYPAVR